MISVHSPQSWAHFNMLGEYDFSNERLQNNTGVLPPKICAQDHPGKLGAAKSVNPQPVQRKMKFPMAESVPMCV